MQTERAAAGTRSCIAALNLPPPPRSAGSAAIAAKLARRRHA